MLKRVGPYLCFSGNSAYSSGDYSFSFKWSCLGSYNYYGISARNINMSTTLRTLLFGE